jgi:hypothetical protein
MKLTFYLLLSGLKNWGAKTRKAATMSREKNRKETEEVYSITQGFLQLLNSVIARSNQK